MKQYLSPITVFILLIFIFSACQSTTEAKKDFDHDGISFNIPKGWKVSEVDTADADYSSISFDPEAANGTSFMFIEWGKGKVELNTQIKHVQSGYLEHPDYQQGNIEFTPIEKVEFAKQAAVQTHFKFSITGIEQEGTLYCFQFPNCDRTLTIVVQGAAVDNAITAESLKNLEKSLTCSK